MEWHENDPVSTSEISRNNLVYNNYQGNRNPFVDHPEFVNLIWGDGFAPEPLNHPSNFNTNNITLTWEDPETGFLPGAYLIRMSDTSFEDIADPVDGTPVSNNFWNKNVDFGVKKCIFSGLTSSTTYYFRIYGYSGSGTGIDYKVDGSVQQIEIEMN
jgi:hypothetical protein